MPDVIVAGDLFVDLILSGFDSWPQPGQEAFAKEYRREAGGGAAITACGLARLGTHVSVLGVVGSDHAGFVADRLHSCGVDTSRLLVDPVMPTAFSVAISTREDRTYLTYAGANRLFPTALEHADFTGVRHVHLACPPDAGQLRRIRSFGCTVSVDAGWHPDWLSDPATLALLPMIDVLLPNEAEAARMTGPDFRRFADLGARRVAVKLGARGAMLVWDGDVISDTPPLVAPVDTVGAGDCFDAGFLHSWLRGMSPAECLRAANICGAASTQAVGGIDGFPCEG